MDVSQKSTAICILDAAGRKLWRGACASDPEQIALVLQRYAHDDVRIGVETGAMSPWLVHGLRSRGFQVVCLDARQVRAVLKMRLNKTDENDAEGLAQVMGMGWYRPVHVKSFSAHRARALVGARAQLVGMTTRLSNHIRGVLKTFGLLPGATRGVRFDRRVEALLVDRPEVASMVHPMLTAWRRLREQISILDKSVRAQVKQDPSCRLLMSVPGIGPLSVLAYVSAIEDPDRFRRSRAVGAHLGLTPRRYQSGEVDRSGRISRCGDGLVRTLLYEAAIVILHRIKRSSDLKDWALAVAKRSGPGKARGAGAQALGPPALHLAVGRAVSLVGGLDENIGPRSDRVRLAS